MGKSEDEGVMRELAHNLFQHFELKKEPSLSARFIFNSAAHLRLQDAKNWHIYEVQDPSSGVVKARIPIHVDGSKAISPFRAPFGFIEIYKKIAVEELQDFFLFIETDLIRRGVKEILLKSYPEVYDENIVRAEGALRRLHYAMAHELSSVITVDRTSFEKKIRISEHQKLRKAVNMFSFEKLKMDQLKETYAFIEKCRGEKDHRLSMTYAELKKTISVFPDNFSLYRVYDTTGTAASAIVVRVDKKILYTFYYAHARKYDKVSPVVFLISGIYEHARDQGIEWIDLGTSMVEGKLSRSLLHFKKSIGGQSYRKLIFQKVLV